MFVCLMDMVGISLRFLHNQGGELLLPTQAMNCRSLVYLPMSPPPERVRAGGQPGKVAAEATSVEQTECETTTATTTSERVRARCV